MGVAVENHIPDAYVVKINADGKTQWTKRFGGSRVDMILGGVEKNSGGFFLGGLTASNDGDVTGHHGGPVVKQKFHQFPAGSRSGPANDAWLIALRPN